MIDEIFDRNYQAGRAEFNLAIGNGFARLGRATRNAFEVLNRIEYNAPWSGNKKDVRRA